ncbi:MAG: TIGR02172 family protein [Bacteroidales bacterium]|nr:TIGR02172 family protein [Bacteroidales bacterium]
MGTYEKINLEDYIQTGEGGTAQAYTRKDGKTLAKLYNSGFEADRAAGEFLTARTVFEMGIPTPEPYRLVSDGERFGAEYELIKNKRSFARILSEEPERLEEISLTFARAARELHAHKADTARLHSYKEVLTQFYRDKNFVPEEYKRRALAFLEKVPEADTCLHGDLQIGNIITDGNRTLWIDVGEFSHGVPEWDISILWTMAHNMKADRSVKLFHITPETFNKHWNIFLPAYLATKDPGELEAFTKRLFPFYAAKVPYVFDMAYHTSLPDEALQKIIQMLPNTSSGVG